MPQVPQLPAVTTGVYPTSSVSALIADAAFLLSPPVAELRQTVAQPLTGSAFTAITFDTEDFDTANGHDNVTNNSRYTAQYPGRYQISGGVGFANNTAGLRITHIRVNGTVLNGSRLLVPAASTGVSASVVAVRTKQVFLNIGDYFEIFAFQDAGAINTDVTAEVQSTMSVRWVSN